MVCVFLFVREQDRAPSPNEVGGLRSRASVIPQQRVADHLAVGIEQQGNGDNWGSIDNVKSYRKL